MNLFKNVRIEDLERQKKSLEIDMDNIAFEMTKLKRAHQLKLEDETHRFNREKKNWEEDKVRLENKLKKDFETKENETIVLLKLESQQKIKQLELDNDRKLLKVEKEFNDRFTKESQELSKKFYSDLTDAFQEMQLHGDKNSKFVQALAMKMAEKMGGPASVNEVKSIEE